MRLQFPHSRFDRLSFATTPVEIFAGEAKIGHASGFYWRRDAKVYLITNWHCVTGNNPLTGMAINSAQRPPTHVVHYPLDLRTTADGSRHFPSRLAERSELFHCDQPTWLQHKMFDSQRIDVVAIQVAARPAVESISVVNEYGFADLFHHVGADVFVVGYPLANFDGWMPPLWKRGSFAGEPILPMGGRPIFPVDVVSTEGMSGSPVFRRIFGPRASVDGTEIALENVMATQFVGVYAGRLANKELDRVGIGYAWYGYLVDELIESGASGTTV